LYIYISKLINNEKYIDLIEINNLMKDIHCNLLYLIPIIDFPKLLVTEQINNKITIIYFKSYEGKYGTDIDDNRIQWDKIINYVYKIYDFDIDKYE
jgi:hypothetical protein